MAMALADEPLLKGWLAPEHLDPGRLTEDAKARPYTRYVVVDNFFRAEALALLVRAFAERTFSEDNEGQNYDSRSSFVRPEDPIGELFYDRVWLEWVHAALGLPYPDRCNVITTARALPPDARGFWPHADDFPGAPKRIAVLVYLTPEWRTDAGGLLQLWQPLPLGDGPSEVLRWDDYLGRRLDFLGERDELIVELGGDWRKPVTRLRLLDQLVPIYNRAVLMDLRPGPAIHSVTPGLGRERHGILQWIN